MANTDIDELITVTFEGRMIATKTIRDCFG